MLLIPPVSLVCRVHHHGTLTAACRPARPSTDDAGVGAEDMTRGGPRPRGPSSWSPWMPGRTRTTLGVHVATDAFAYDSHRRLECKTSERPGACAGSDPSRDPAITRCGALGASPRPIRRAGRQPWIRRSRGCPGRHQVRSIGAPVGSHRGMPAFVEYHPRRHRARLRTDPRELRHRRRLAIAAHRSPA